MSEPAPFHVVDVEDSRRNPEVIATLPLLQEAAELLLDCAATGGIGLISGPAGSGKSVSLRWLATRYTSIGLTGECVSYCCQSNAGATRGVKDLLAHMGVGGAILATGHGAPMQLILKLALREFVRKGVRCILLDESDRWDAEAMGGIVALHDHLRENQHQIALLAVTMLDMPVWLANAEAARSRTLRTLGAEHVSAEQMLGLLALWGDEFAKFTAVVESGNREAGALAHLIFEQTGSGDMRRLNFFVRLYQRHCSGKAVSDSTVSLALAKMVS